MSTIPDPQLQQSTPGYHGAVSDFKRRLIEATLHQARGNRTHAARALGLQRTYLLRLIRELGVAAPPPAPRGRSVATPPPGSNGDGNRTAAALGGVSVAATIQADGDHRRQAPADSREARPPVATTPPASREGRPTPPRRYGKAASRVT